MPYSLYPTSDAFPSDLAVLPAISDAACDRIPEDLLPPHNRALALSHSSIDVLATTPRHGNRTYQPQSNENSPRVRMILSHGQSLSPEER